MWCDLCRSMLGTCVPHFVTSTGQVAGLEMVRYSHSRMLSSTDLYGTPHKSRGNAEPRQHRLSHAFALGVDNANYWCDEIKDGSCM